MNCSNCSAFFRDNCVCSKCTSYHIADMQWTFDEMVYDNVAEEGITKQDAVADVIDHFNTRDMDLSNIDASDRIVQNYENVYERDDNFFGLHYIYEQHKKYNIKYSLLCQNPLCDAKICISCLEEKMENHRVCGGMWRDVLPCLKCSCCKYINYRHKYDILMKHLESFFSFIRYNYIFGIPEIDDELFTSKLQMKDFFLNYSKWKGNNNYNFKSMLLRTFPVKIDEDDTDGYIHAEEQGYQVRSDYVSLTQYKKKILLNYIFYRRKRNDNIQIIFYNSLKTDIINIILEYDTIYSMLK